MSGAAEGIAGLALGAISLSACFITCIDAFNIGVTARDFGEDYEVLCADLALQRLRFCLWGEAVGLVSSDAVHRPVQRHPRLETPEIESALVQTLQAIQFLLLKTNQIRDQFSSEPPRPSRGLAIFRDRFEEFGLRARRNRKQKSVAAVTKWAVYSRDKFQERIEQLKSLIDGLEKVSESLGVRNVQQSRMRTEIESLDDVDSLRLIRDASTDSQHDLSDAASHRLLSIENASVKERASTSNTAESFHTAVESQLSRIGQDLSSALSIAEDRFNSCMQSSLPQNSRLIANLTNGVARPRIWIAGPKTDRYGSKLKAFNLYNMAGLGIFPRSLSYLQEDLLKLSERENLWDRDALADCNFQLEPISKLDLRRRLRRELQKLQEFTQPGIACFPINFRLDHLLAGIEGPPDSPYEGGVFWIDIRPPPEYPVKPPIVQFLTRIYHPNIDSRGKICLDTLENGWYPTQSIWSLLISVCSLLDDPGLNDPLVPEIAETYCQDYNLYYENAKTYTARYAFAELTANEAKGDLNETPPRSTI